MNVTIQKRVAQNEHENENEPNVTYDERMRNYEASKASNCFNPSHLTATRPGGGRKVGSETSDIYPMFERNHPRPKEDSNLDFHHQVNHRRV